MRIDKYLTTLDRPLRLTALLIAAGAVATTAGALGQAGLKLFIAGKTASSDIRIIDGKPYVPLANMAKAMNGSTGKHKGGGHKITLCGGDTTTPEAGAVAGGANEVRGTRGKVGQVLFNGKWRFSVLGIDHAASYDSQFLPAKRAFTPAGDSDELVIARCKMKNGQNATQVAILSQIYP